jgi:hypothetical protein
MSRSTRFITSLIVLTACGRSDTQRTRDQSRNQASVCASPAGGIVLSRDRIGSLSTHATLGALKRECAAGESAEYDDNGVQAAAWSFPFVGARVLAVQSKHAFYEPTRDDEVPDFWSIYGDSARLPDGQLVPATLGVLKARYPFIGVNDNTGLDDTELHAWSCQLPYLLFALDVNDTARHVPDSARVTRIDLIGTDGIERACRERQRAAGR